MSEVYRGLKTSYRATMRDLMEGVCRGVLA